MLRKKKNQIPRHKKYRQRIAPGKKGRYFDITLIVLSAFVVVLLGSTAIRLVQGETKELPHEITIIRTQIANGCGVDGAAQKFAEWVKSKSSDVLKYDIIDVTDFENSVIPKTRILVRDPMALSKTGMISTQLGIPRENISMSELTDNFLSLDITIVVGGDFADFEKPVVMLQTEILNGCGIKGAASQFSIRLAQMATDEMTFDVVKTENFKTFNKKESVLIIKSKKAEKISKKLAEMLDIKKDNIITASPDKQYSEGDITIVIGQDWGNRLTAN
jgi:hypothetical protein